MRLYKYLTLDNALLALENGLRVTQPDALNDRKEIRYSFDRDELRRSYERMRQLTADTKTITALLLQGQLLRAVGVNAPAQPDQLPKALLAEVLRNPPPITEALIDFTRNMFDRIRLGIGVISFSELDKDDLMWAHYGGDQTGCVFQFDFPSSSCFDPGNTLPDIFFERLIKVRYLLELTIPNFDPKSVIDVYVTKLSKWSYENEWRSFHALSDSSVKGPFGKDARGFEVFATRKPLEWLTGVIIGASVDASRMANFRTAKAVRELKLPVRQFRNRDGIILDS